MTEVSVSAHTATGESRGGDVSRTYDAGQQGGIKTATTASRQRLVGVFVGRSPQTKGLRVHEWVRWKSITLLCAFYHRCNGISKLVVTALGLLDANY